ALFADGPTAIRDADVSVWMAHLGDGFSIGVLPKSDNLSA
ncbi:hypothetical protein IFM89_007373, partial [Coptis chinensis]